MIPHSLQNARIRAEMILAGRRCWNPFMEQLQRPREVQAKVLHDILAMQATTGFGRAHRFAKLRGYHDFRLAIPIQTYEDLRLDIEDQEEFKEPRLNSEQPETYALTSGTTGKPKLIPILNRTREGLRHFQRLSTYAQFEAVRGLFDGKMLVIAGPEVEGYLETGTSYGSMSGFLTAALPGALQQKLCIPDALYEIDDYQRKYFYLAACALAEPHVSVVASANPATFLKLLDIGRQHFSHVVELLSSHASGQAEGPLPVPSKRRLRQLQEMVGHEDQVSIQNLWPDLKGVVTWMGGSGSVGIPSLRAKLSPQTALIEMGYLSSECVGSVNVDPRTNRCVPMIQETFFEFVPQSDWDAERPYAVTVEQLEEGQKYYVVVTTANGLYRYFMNDLVEVTGRFHQTPTIAFVQKGKGVTNMTGEKLYEYHVTEAMAALQRRYRIHVEFYVMLADPQARHYTLYLEHPSLDAFAGYHIETALSQMNAEFQKKRESGRLEPLKIVTLQPGTAEAYKAHCLQQGQREAQLKILKLQYAKDCSFNFLKYVRTSP